MKPLEALTCSFVLVLVALTNCAVAEQILVAPVVEYSSPSREESIAMQAAEHDPSLFNLKQLAQIRESHARGLLAASNDRSSTVNLAVRYAESAAALVPQEPRNWATLYQAYKAMSELSEDYFIASAMALEALENLVTLSPNDAGAHGLLGVELSGNEECDAALHHLEKSMLMSWDMVTPATIAAANYCYISSPRTSQGIRFYDTLIRKFPQYGFIKLSKAILLKQQRNWRRADLLLQQIIDDASVATPDKEYAKKLRNDFRAEMHVQKIEEQS